MTPYAQADLIAAVERSPAAAARHDRPGWVGLFTIDGTVEDPVGSAPHRGRDAIGRFYDTFIGPRDIVFHSHADIVCDTTVIREVTLEVTMRAGVALDVPAILRYRLDDSSGELKIAELQAFWELPPMLWQFARRGLPAVPVAVGLTRSLLVNQHLGGTAGFLAGLYRPARRHRTDIETLVTALTTGDQLTTRRMLSAGAQLTVGDDEPLTGDVLLERLRGARVSACITAGPTTAVSLRSDSGPAVLLVETEPWTVRLFA